MERYSMRRMLFERIHEMRSNDHLNYMQAKCQPADQPLQVSSSTEERSRSARRDGTVRPHGKLGRSAVHFCMQSLQAAHFAGSYLHQTVVSISPVVEPARAIYFSYVNFCMPTASYCQLLAIVYCLLLPIASYC
jgi:hypothetical protein